MGGGDVMALKVSEVARLCGLSVRALHHYDEIGLCRPSGRSEAGYRLYAPDDVERLQQVLFFRELDFSLEDIQNILDDPDYDLDGALALQREMLAERAVRVQALLAAVDATIVSRAKGTTMTNEERLQVFGDFDPKEYEPEAKERWGDSEAYAESALRTRSYTKADWQTIRAEGDAVFADLARLAATGTEAQSEAAMDVAERHRLHIDRWFYPCPPRMHRGLGDLYVNDPRFAANLDKHRPGLATYAREAWRANAKRQLR
jgi:DNA-binding transcriptional MerR regulator